MQWMSFPFEGYIFKEESKHCPQYSWFTTNIELLNVIPRKIFWMKYEACTNIFQILGFVSMGEWKKHFSLNKPDWLDLNTTTLEYSMPYETTLESELKMYRHKIGSSISMVISQILLSEHGSILKYCCKYFSHISYQQDIPYFKCTRFYHLYLNVFTIPASVLQRKKIHWNGA